MPNVSIRKLSVEITYWGEEGENDDNVAREIAIGIGEAIYNGVYSKMSGNHDRSVMMNRWERKR